MEERKEEALVLEQAEIGETSQRLVVLARASGVLSLMHKGGRRPRRGTASSGVLDLFASAELRFVPPRSEGGMGSLREASLTAPRLGLRQNLTLLSLGAVLCDILRACRLEHEEESAALHDLACSLLDAWNSLAPGWRRGEEAPEAAWQAADLLGRGWVSLLRRLGMVPQWATCVYSGDSLAPARPGALQGHVDLTAGGRVGRRAARQGPRRARTITPDAELAIQAWLEGRGAAELLPAKEREPLPAVKRLEAPLNFLAAWTRHHVDFRLDSFRFLTERLFKKPKARRSPRGE